MKTVANHLFTDLRIISRTLGQLLCRISTTEFIKKIDTYILLASIHVHLKYQQHNNCQVAMH
jgi:hypothetical protein